MSEPRYTMDVIKARDEIMKLTAAELLALRELLEGYYELPPDVGVREPRDPRWPLLSGGAEAHPEDPQTLRDPC